jgi:hypothetical protein
VVPYYEYDAKEILVPMVIFFISSRHVEKVVLMSRVASREV